MDVVAGDRKASEAILTNGFSGSPSESIFVPNAHDAIMSSVYVPQ
jgi:hypothetical protein